MNKVVVLGSINMDMVMETKKMPKIGETILGESIDYYMGGKGANQAVAAARVGGNSLLIGKVGEDTFGQKALTHLAQEQVNVTHISVEKNMFTGVASIFKLATDNAIVVLAGANMLLNDVTTSLHQSIDSDDIFLTQLEIPLETVKSGLALAKSQGAKTILNPAPFNKDIIDCLDLVDIITPNETELEGLMQQTFPSDEALEAAMLDWSDQYATQLIVTRGEKGISYVQNKKIKTIPAIKVAVTDTTGAGDTFNGLLAAFLAEQMPLAKALEWASIGASLSVTKLGAQTGMPAREEIIKISK